MTKKIIGVWVRSPAGEWIVPPRESDLALNKVTARAGVEMTHAGNNIVKRLHVYGGPQRGWLHSCASSPPHGDATSMAYLQARTDQIPPGTQVSTATHVVRQRHLPGWVTLSAVRSVEAQPQTFSLRRRLQTGQLFPVGSLGRLSYSWNREWSATGGALHVTTGPTHSFSLGNPSMYLGNPWSDSWVGQRHTYLDESATATIDMFDIAVYGLLTAVPTYLPRVTVIWCLLCVSAGVSDAIGAPSVAGGGVDFYYFDLNSDRLVDVPGPLMAARAPDPYPDYGARYPFSLNLALAGSIPAPALSHVAGTEYSGVVKVPWTIVVGAEANHIGFFCDVQIPNMRGVQTDDGVQVVSGDVGIRGWVEIQDVQLYYEWVV